MLCNFTRRKKGLCQGSKKRENFILQKFKYLGAMPQNHGKLDENVRNDTKMILRRVHTQENIAGKFMKE